MKKILFVLFVLFVFAGVSCAEKFSTHELIFDGVSNSPDVPEQGMDIHMYYDGEYIWAAYTDFTHNSDNTGNYMIRLNPADDSVMLFPLVDADAGQTPILYQAVAGNDSDTIIAYATYGNTRAIWRFKKSDATSVYFEIEESGNFGGKAQAAVINEHDCVVLTSTYGGKPVVYDFDSEAETTLDLGTAHYGIQTDGQGNFFVADLTNNIIKAVTFNSEFVPNVNATIGTFGAVDLAWDGTYLWSSSSTNTSTYIEQFEPVYTAAVVTGLVHVRSYLTGMEFSSVAPSIKATSKYVGAAWEKISPEKAYCGITILNRETGLWEQLESSTTNGDTAEAVAPWSAQYWPTVTIEIAAPQGIYVAGYNPIEQDGGFFQDAAIPNHSLRLVRLTPIPLVSQGVTIRGGTIQ